MTTPQHIILKLSHDEAALVVEALEGMAADPIENPDERLVALQIAGVLEGELESRA